MVRDYTDILLAHFRSELPIMLWGSSGYGKTGIIKSFAEANGFNLIVIHAQYLDPLALFIPSTSEMKDLGFVKVYPSEILYRVFNAKAKTLLFLDELTRAREDTFNILTELLLDRSVFGYQLPPHVMIVAASNFAEEDTGVKDLPDAVMQRLTHMIHAPDEASIVRSLRNKSARDIIAKDPKIVRQAAKYPIYDQLKACPRQIDACGVLAESGLRGENLMEVCRGRVGIETGTELAIRFEMALTGKLKLLPERIEPSELSRIARAEREGGVLEVVRFLCDQMNDSKNSQYIANYLLEFASPEVCRSMQVHGFSHSFRNVPRQSNGKCFMRPSKDGSEPQLLEAGGKPWQWYAIRLGKITPR